MPGELKGIVLCVENVKRIKGHGALCREWQGNYRAWCSVSRMSTELKGIVLCVENVKGINGHSALCRECQGN